MKTSILLLFIFTLKFAAAMEPRELIRKMQQAYASERIEYTCTYDIFKGFKDGTPKESSQGYVYRNKGLLYQKVGHSESVYGRDFLIRTNRAEMALSIDAPQQIPGMEIDLDVALKECSGETVEDKGNYYEVRLNISAASELPVSVVLLQIAKSSFHLRQLDIYFTTVQDFAAEGQHPDLDNVHLRITFNGFNANPAEQHSLFQLSTYLTNNNDVLVPAGEYQGYELVDNRIK